MTFRVQLRDRIAKTRHGTFPSESQVRLRVEDDVAVFKPNGERLLLLKRAALPAAALEAAYPFLHAIRNQTTDLRGTFMGQGSTLTRQRVVTAAGTLSRTERYFDDEGNKAKVASTIVGYFDRYPRIPYCRESVLSTKYPEAWGATLPLLQAAGAVFAGSMSDRYQVQLAAAKKTHPAYVIKDTPFTTITVNNCTVGACHQDAGDYKPGFGVMAVLRYGKYSGCEFVYPDYGVAADLGHGDLVFFDPHETHGNLPYYDQMGPQAEPENGGWERISIVMYFRERMLECLPPAQELERAKALHGTLDLLGQAP